MKKLISLLTILVLVAALATTAFAAEETALVVDTVEAAAGKEVVVNVSIVNNPGFTIAEMVIEFDTTALELVSMAPVGGADWNCIPTVNENTGYFSVVAGGADVLAGDVTLLAVTLKVKDDVKPGTYTVKAVVDYICDDAADFVSAAEFVGGVVIPCTDHAWGEWTVTTPATCETAGVETRTCAYCGLQETREIAALGHAWGEWEVTTEATCAGAGVKTRTCANCGATETEEIPAAEGHTWNEGEVKAEATCCEDGLKVFTCTVCGATKEEAIAATGEHKIIYVDNEDGETHRIVCENSGKVLTDKEAHTYGDWIDDANAPGWKYQVCDRCGYEHREEPGETGDNTMIAVAMATVSMMGIALVVSKKKEF